MVVNENQELLNILWHLKKFQNLILMLYGATSSVLLQYINSALGDTPPVNSNKEIV